MDNVSWDAIGKGAAVAFAAVVILAALATEKGRAALADVGIGLAALALKLAERAADDPERGARAAGAREKLGK